MSTETLDQAESKVVEIEATLLVDELQMLREGARIAKMTENDMLRQALRDAIFFQRNTPPGAKIFIERGDRRYRVR